MRIKQTKEIRSYLKRLQSNIDANYQNDYLDGHGQIIRSSYSDEGEYVVTVSFETGGIKKFLPKYQKNSLLVEDDL